MPDIMERADEVQPDDGGEGDADLGDTAPDDTVNTGQDEETDEERSEG